MRHAFAAAVLCAPLLVSAQTGLTGNDLHGWFNGTQVQVTIAMAYVRGFMDAAEFQQYTQTVSDASTTRAGFLYCKPAGATIEQGIDIVRADLASQPGQRHIPASLFVSVALRRAWPCH